MAVISNVQYSNADNMTVRCTMDGQTTFVPADPKNRHWREIQAKALPIAAYVAPPVESAADAAAGALRGNPGVKAMVRMLAKRFNLTEQQLIDAIKAEAGP